jgi:hypothetical protein
VVETREVRQRAEEMFTKSYEATRDLKAEKARYLEKYLSQIPKHFERRNHGDQSWVYYGLEREPLFPAHHYCRPLDERYYLDISSTTASTTSPTSTSGRRMPKRPSNAS